MSITEPDTSNLIGVASILQDIWGRELSSPPLDSNARVFTELNANSFDIISVSTAITANFGVSVPLTELVSADSIIEQAKLVGRALNTEIKHNSIISLRLGEPHKNSFFLAHGADGHPYNYLRLARRMNSKRPVRALVSPALNPDVPFRRTPELLDIYLSGLIQEQQTGSYILGGWSYGALVAFDLAKLLIEAGKRVSAIVMFDGMPPNTDRPVHIVEAEHILYDGVWDSNMEASPYRAAWEGLPQTLRFIWGMSRELNRGSVANLTRFVLGSRSDESQNICCDESELKQFERLVARIEEQDGALFRQMFLPGQSANQLHRAAVVFKSNLLDSFSKRAPWVFPGEICQIACPGNMALKLWQAYSSMPLRILEFDFKALGGKDAHTSIMDEPNVRLFSKSLDEYLESVEARF